MTTEKLYAALMKGIHQIECDHLCAAGSDQYNMGWDDALCLAENLIVRIFPHSVGNEKDNSLQDGTSLKGKPASADDPVNHPAHYTSGSIEVIDYIEDQKLPYHLGNAVKYISRAGKKDPDKTVEDLKKAVWYINRYIEKLEREAEALSRTE